jgi:hypothetical protein
MTTNYEQFIKNKSCLVRPAGFEIELKEINPLLKDHQQVCVQWAVRQGRAALFEAFGLGKSVQQLEILRLVLKKLGGGRVLIVAPLGVRQEFKKDVYLLKTGDSPKITEQQRRELRAWQAESSANVVSEIKFVRRSEEVTEENGLYITNYESVRDGKLNVDLFDAVSLDEASCLRGFGGTKTFREFMALFAGDRKTLNERVRSRGVSYRFVATATPSPNDFIELLAYSAFLDVMDVSAAKTRFFKRDSTKADKLTLHPHKEQEFWLWVASWAMFLQRPSDLGFSDKGYALPEKKIFFHKLPVDHTQTRPDKSGQGLMFRNAALGLSEAAREKRDTLADRTEKMLEIINASPNDHFLLWHDLEDERRAIEEVLPSYQYNRWLEAKDGDKTLLSLYERHYSAYQYADGRERKLFVGPGEKLILKTLDGSAGLAWRKFIDDSGQTGINCAFFRNEGLILSSELILEAEQIAWQKWSGERLYTYVNPNKIKSKNPGCCFLKAGWRKCGKTKNGLLILEKLAENALPLTVERKQFLQSVYGSQDLDKREQIIIDFADGKLKYLAGKPQMLGSGCNFQRHCHKAIFLGIGYKFNDFIQAIHRIHRFLQEREVEIHIIYAESEQLILESLLEKWERDTRQKEAMSEIIKKYGLSHEALNRELTRAMGVERVEVKGERFTLVNNDCVLETGQMEENSIGLILSSIPFSTQYEYSPNYSDFGHTDNNEHFFEQMNYLTPNLLKILQPGRIAAIHVKDRIVPGGMTGLGFQVVYPFHARCIEHYTKHGFAYLGMKTIVTDVVRENNQTYRLGWTEQCKDGTKMGVGMPEYLLLFRKPPTDTTNSYADVPVVKSKQKYSRSRWQTDAHGFARSNGNRLLTPADLKGVPHDVIFRLFKQHSLNNVYDFENHVALAESLEAEKRLPTSFMLLQPQSWSDEVWTDITRMLTLNGAQSAKGKEMHLCPMQFDLADRVIEQLSMEGETVFDPFAGLGSVPYRAVLKRRKGYGVELSPNYFLDAIGYLKAAETEVSSPSLFDLLEAEKTENAGTEMLAA